MLQGEDLIEEYFGCDLIHQIKTGTPFLQKSFRLIAAALCKLLSLGLLSMDDCPVCKNMEAEVL